MTIAPGSRLGPYEIVAPLGAGGMGEVWRARDARLQRDVAIKVLPAAVAGDAERLARFEREARLLAALNHPHIASLYGLEDAGGVPALVMELVEGPTLAERIEREGALPVDEALAIARTIAEAVEYAHERGIVHRDLKPGNVKLGEDGAVKVLDFGLAKALASEETTSSPSLTHSPTRTVGTHVGVLLGTAAYMAPEQARGKPVDRRADVWAFGALLYELLTGRLAFAGETVSDTIAAILERTPDWSTLPARTPERVRDLLRRALEKDARQRLRDMGDARIELEAVIAAGGAAAPTTRTAASKGGRARTVTIAAAVALAAFAAAWWGRGALGPSSGAERILRLSATRPASITGLRAAFFTSDGRALVATGRSLEVSSEDGERVIYRRALDGDEWTPIAGTEGIESYTVLRDEPWIYFLSPVAKGSVERVLRRVPVDGGTPPVDVMPWKRDWGQWEVLPGGRVAVVTTSADRCGIIASGAREPAEWKAIQSEGELNDITLDQPLPHGSACMVTIYHYSARGFALDVAVLDLESGRVTTIEPDAGSPQYLASGHLLMTRNSTVLVVPFDERARRARGRPVAVFDGVRVPGPGEHGTVRASRAGDLVYAPGSDAMSSRRLVVLEPDGSVRPWNETRAAINGPPALAPDGTWAAVTQLRPSGWLFQLVRADAGGSSVRRLAAFDNEDCGGAQISPDGRWIAYGRSGVDSTAGVWLMSVDGRTPPRRLVAGRSVGGLDQPAAWTPDGRTLLLSRNEPSGRYLRRVAVDEPGAEPVEVLRADHDLFSPSLSPDGRWLSYLSREAGLPQLLVTAWHADRPVTPGVPVSSLPARHHWWPARGGGLLFVTQGGVLWETTVGPGPTVASPRRRASLGELISDNEVTSLPDGRLLLVQKGAGEGDVPSLDLVLGFEQEMRRALARAREGGR